MKLDARQIERFIARPDPAQPVILLFGPDSGRIDERGTALGRTVTPDLSDPFRVSELTGEQIEREPGRLIEEAQALCLMGGRRLVRIRRATEACAAALVSLLELAPIEAMVVIEAEDLATSSKLRQLAEKHAAIASIACYRDEQADLGQLVRAQLAAASLRIDPDAQQLLESRLGADRGVSLRELDKLTLYVGTRADRTVHQADVEAVIGESSAVAIDDLLLAAFLGDVARADAVLDRLLAEGEAPVRLVRAASALTIRLLRLRSEADRGTPLESLIAGARPPIFFRHRPRIKAAAGRWPVSSLTRQSEDLLEAELAIKRARAPAELLCRRAMATLGSRAQTLARG